MILGRQDCMLYCAGIVWACLREINKPHYPKNRWISNGAIADFSLWAERHRIPLLRQFLGGAGLSLHHLFVTTDSFLRDERRGKKGACAESARL